METAGSNVDIRTTRPLAFREGLTVVVGWDKGFVQAPSLGAKISQFVLKQLGAGDSGAGVSGDVLAVVVARTRSAGGRGRPCSTSRRRGFRRARPGHWWITTAAMRDITATIVDLAVRGYLTIEEQTKEHIMGLYANKEYVFHLQKGGRRMGQHQAARNAAAGRALR